MTDIGATDNRGSCKRCYEPVVSFDRGERLCVSCYADDIVAKWDNDPWVDEPWTRIEKGNR